MSADNGTIKVRLIEGVLETAPPGTSAVTRLEINTGAAGFRHGARIYKGRSFHNSRAKGHQEREGLPSSRPVDARLSSGTGRNPHGTHSASAGPRRQTGHGTNQRLADGDHIGIRKQRPKALPIFVVTQG